MKRSMGWIHALLATALVCITSTELRAAISAPVMTRPDFTTIDALSFRLDADGCDRLDAPTLPLVPYATQVERVADTFRVVVRSAPNTLGDTPCGDAVRHYEFTFAGTTDIGSYSVEVLSQSPDNPLDLKPLGTVAFTVKLTQAAPLAFEMHVAPGLAASLVAPVGQSFLPAPAVQVVDSNGAPIENFLVHFRVAPCVELPGQPPRCPPVEVYGHFFGSDAIQVRTDQNGIASAMFRAGTVPGEYGVIALAPTQSTPGGNVYLDAWLPSLVGFTVTQVGVVAASPVPAASVWALSGLMLGCLFAAYRGRRARFATS